MYTIKVVISNNGEDFATTEFTEQRLGDITTYMDSFFDIRRQSVNNRIETALDKEQEMKNILQELKKERLNEVMSRNKIN